MHPSRASHADARDELLTGSAPRASQLLPVSHSYERTRAKLHAQAVGRVAKLTQTQREVISMLARGSTFAEIGTELGIGLNTVKTHVLEASQITGVSGRVRLAVLALRAGLTSIWAPSTDEAKLLDR
jgi:DNA-binding CsgD family transcriptional regulator